MNADPATAPDSTRSSRRTAVIGDHHRHTAIRTRRGYLKAAAFLLVVLVAGVVIGISGTLFFMKNRMHRSQPRAEQLGKSIVERLDSHVSLSGEERATIESIVSASMGAVESMRQDTMARIRQEFDTMNDSMDDILGPERSAQWEKDKQERYGKFYRSKEERHNAPGRREPQPRR